MPSPRGHLSPPLKMHFFPSSSLSANVGNKFPLNALQGFSEPSFSSFGLPWKNRLPHVPSNFHKRCG
ncbi:hypothetical protein F01_230192 [Burkholderia cenocepacia]|nr:hypothetical protein F01_230192 [Burkholderia cenocepacia]